jgi:hypothetical protein
VTIVIWPSKTFISCLALALLVARVVADDAQDAAALHDLALFTDFLDAGSDLHGVLSKRVDDLTAVGIELGKLHADSGPAYQPDDCVAEGGCDTRSDLSTTVEAHSEKSAG